MGLRRTLTVSWLPVPEGVGMEGPGPESGVVVSSLLDEELGMALMSSRWSPAVSCSILSVNWRKIFAAKDIFSFFSDQLNEMGSR